MGFNHYGDYVCECGKHFSYSQKFNGHKTHCIEHLVRTGRLIQRIQAQKDFAVIGKQVAVKLGSLRAEKNSFEKEKFLLGWISDRHQCERCGKVMNEYYGSGRFCSRSCANSRHHSEKTKQRIGLSVTTSLVNSEHAKLTVFKCGTYKGIYCQSSYELAFLAHSLMSGVKIERSNVHFKYVNPTDGKEHCYIPDFYLPETDTFVELKSEHTRFFDFDEVASKCSSVQQCGHGVLYINDQSIKSYISCVQQHFNIKDITALYESA